MNTSYAEPLLFMLIAVTREAQTLRDEVDALELPPGDESYFHTALNGIEQQAAECISLFVKTGH